MPKLLVQIAAGEAKNPRRNLPKAIRRVYIRILLFYIGGVTIIGLLVPSNDPNLGLNKGTAAASPFVIAIKRSGIKALPHVRTRNHHRSFDLTLTKSDHQRLSANVRMVSRI